MKRPHCTKSGPGRRHKDGTFRGGNSERSAGSYGRGLTNHFTRLQREAIEAKRKVGA